MYLHLRFENYRLSIFESWDEVRRKTDKWLEICNHQRPRNSLGGMTPGEYLIKQITGNVLYLTRTSGGMFTLELFCGISKTTVRLDQFVHINTRSSLSVLPNGDEGKQAAGMAREVSFIQMIGTGYQRVSKKRPCCICGKPDWCSITTTETISFCARSILNADRISRHGWGVYYQDGSRSDFVVNFERNINRFTKRNKLRISKGIASPAIRDRVYRKLIELSPASANREIVNGRGGLAERGIQDISRYGHLPRLVNERRVLLERVIEALAKEGIRSLDGIPGFWRDASGRWRLWSEHDSLDDLMLIPFVGADGLIRACQIRFMRYSPNKSGRYVWLSSLKEKDGCGPGAPLHHADPLSPRARSVLVIEGALKAATAQRFLPDRYVVGNSGVATSHHEIVATARGKPLEIAFDNDSFTNAHVARALSALVRLRASDQASSGYNEDIRIVAWDKRIKGLDDALLARVPLEHLTVAQWLKHLAPECLDQATRQLSSA